MLTQTLRPLRFAILLRLSFTCFALLAPAAPSWSEEEGAPWKSVSQTKGITIYERVHAGSSLKEYRGVGVIAAPPAAVKKVLDDVEQYPSFMPYVIEARVISTDSNSRVSYQRLSPPIVGDRDYTVHVHYETLRNASGPAFCNRWQVANDLGPEEKKGVTRVKVTEGSWLIEPLPGGVQSQATYTIYSDSGGNIPSYLANSASKTAIPKLFEAVRKQVQLPKYAP